MDVTVSPSEETVWLTQKGMSELFGCSTDNISYHLRRIFKSGELEENSVTEQSSATASDVKEYKTNFYNLDAILSVGYRVQSKRGIQFRKWASSILKRYTIDGYTCITKSEKGCTITS